MTPQKRPAAAVVVWRVVRTVVVVVIGVPVLALGVLLIGLRHSRGRLSIDAHTRHPDTGVGTRLRGVDVELKQAPHARQEET